MICGHALDWLQDSLTNRLGKRNKRSRTSPVCPSLVLDGHRQWLVGISEYFPFKRNTGGYSFSCSLSRIANASRKVSSALTRYYKRPTSWKLKYPGRPASACPTIT